MDIKEIEGENSEQQATLEIEVNGKTRVCAYPGEPEDFSLERDLSFAFEIVPLMQEAYEAGKNGEDFIVREVGS